MSEFLSDFARTHAVLFDELERQGMYRVDVVKLTRAVLNAQAIIAQSTTCATPSTRSGPPPPRCETCE